MIILRGVNVFPTQIEEIVLSTAGLSPHFQLTLSHRERMDEMTVLVEAATDCPSERREAAGPEIAAAVKDRVGVSVGVSIVDPDALERSMGKMRRVIDNRAG
jgi:phenylacetate-CoA ligase